MFSIRKTNKNDLLVFRNGGLLLDLQLFLLLHPLVNVMSG